MFHAQAGLSNSVNQDSLPQPDLAAGNGNDNHRLVFADTDLCRARHIRYANRRQGDVSGECHANRTRVEICFWA